MLGPFLLNSSVLADSRVLEGWVLGVCASHYDVCLELVLCRTAICWVCHTNTTWPSSEGWMRVYLSLGYAEEFLVAMGVCVHSSVASDIGNAWCIENERIMTLWSLQYNGQKAASSPWQGVTRHIFHVLIYSNACTWVFPNHPQYISQKSCFLSLDGMLLI